MEYGYWLNIFFKLAHSNSIVNKMKIECIQAYETACKLGELHVTLCKVK